MDEPRSADVGRRFLAGLLDLALLLGLGLVCSLGPLVYGGAALPMIGALVAIIGYSIVPASSFGATLGMAIAGIRIRSIRDARPDATEIAFRELVGRGLIGAAYFTTVAIGLAGHLTGYLRFFVPTGLGLFLFGISGLLLLLSAGSHLSIVLRDDGRALHDLFAKTIVVRHTEGVSEQLDEEAASFESAKKRARIRGFVIAEVLLVAIALGLPLVVGQNAEEELGSLEDRVALKKAEKLFEKDPTDPAAMEELVSIHEKSGRKDRASQVEAHHRAALEAAGLKPSDRDYLVQKHRALLKQYPCSLESAVALGDRFNALTDYDAALALVSSLETPCGVRPRMWWISLTAHRKKNDLDAAIADSTRLIASRPTDSDFWWWRGEDYAKKGDVVRADSDYRQSMAVYADGFAAQGFAELMRSHDRCEGIFALQHLLDENQEAADSWAEASLQELQVGADCASLIGKGSVKLSIASDASVRTSAQLDGRKGRFLVHPTGYVTITKAFADRIGVVASEPSVEVRIAEKVVSARVLVIDRIAVGGSRAEKVRVAVVDELPADIDGLLGLSYLWRFRVERSDRALALVPR